MKRVALASFCGVLAAGAAAQSMAADDITITRPHSSMASNLYLGASFGNARYDRADDSSAAFALFGGYQLNEVLSLDLAYSDLGKAEKSGTKTEAATFSLGVLGRVSVRNDLSVFGKVGLSNWNLDVTDVTLGSDSDSDIDVSYGFGADYDISGSTAVRFGVDFYSMNGADLEEDVRVFSIGFVYRP